SGFSDIYQMVLSCGDSIALSREQMEKVQAQQRVLTMRADSVYTTLATYLFNLAPDYSATDAAKRVADANLGMWDIIYAEAPFITSLLTPAQVRLLPGPLRSMVMTPSSKGRFYGFRCG